MAQSIPRLIGRYEIQRAIGTGGMGDLYLARDPMIDRLIAIKLLRDGIDSPEILERFSREARSAGRLHHPNIVTIFDVGEHEGRPFIAMEFVQGETLSTIIGRRPALPLAQKLGWMEALCAGLHYAHRAGIVHRDMKPANVIVEDGGGPKILDFGIAHIAATGITHGPIGTLNYMAPEQIDGHAIDSRTDIFSLGALFYELLAYRRVFEGDVASGTISKILLGHRRPIESVVPEIDPALARIINRCLESAPADRYPDCASLARDIERIRLQLAGDEILVPLEAPPSADADGGPPTQVDARTTRRLELQRLRDEQIRTHLDAARTAAAAERYDDVIAQCDQVLLLDPDQVEAQDLGDQARLARDEKNVKEWTLAARRELQAGRFAAASEFAERAYRLRPQTPEIGSLREVIAGALRHIAEVPAPPAPAPTARPAGTKSVPVKPAANKAGTDWVVWLRRNRVTVAAALAIVAIVGGALAFARWRSARNNEAVAVNAGEPSTQVPIAPPAVAPPDAAPPPEPTDPAAAAPTEPPAPPPTTEPPATTAEGRGRGRAETRQFEAESRAWSAITNNNSITDYEAFLAKYPNGVYADFAKARIEALKLDQENARALAAAAEREKTVAAERARAEAAERDRAAAAAEAARREEEERVRNAPVVIKVRHNHEGFLGVFGGKDDCQGELQVNRAQRTVSYATSTTKDAFQAACADVSKLGIRRDGKTELVDFTAVKRRWNFTSLAENQNPKAIVDLIRAACGTTP
jgi:hypothetical protein